MATLAKEWPTYSSPPKKDATKVIIDTDAPVHSDPYSQSQHNIRRGTSSFSSLLFRSEGGTSHVSRVDIRIQKCLTEHVSLVDIRIRECLTEHQRTPALGMQAHWYTDTLYFLFTGMWKQTRTNELTPTFW